MQRDLPFPLGSAEATEWTLKKTPKAWTEPAVVLKWAGDRGIVKPTGATRLGERVWSFQAEVAGTDQSFKFTSEIIAVVAMRGRSSGTSQESQPRKVSSAWRVPKPKQEDEDDEEPRVRRRAFEPSEAKPQECLRSEPRQDEATGEAADSSWTASATREGRVKQHLTTSASRRSMPVQEVTASSWLVRRDSTTKRPRRPREKTLAQG